MRTRDLSTREKEIVDLCVEGFTNEAIAHKLGVSVGTVNTYWLRIKLKVGGFGRTDTVAKIIRDRAETALREAELALSELNEIASKREEILQELRTASALLQFAMDHMKATVWATDEELCIQMLAYGDYPSGHFGARWEAGKTVYELFDTEDAEDLAVKAHLAALKGAHTEVRLQGDFSNMILSVMPMADDLDEVIGCVSMLKAVGD